MKYRTSIKTVFNCPLERAFRTPMLCDVTKVHTGYFLMPKVTHCTEDETWGKPGGYRKVFAAKNFMFKGGEAALDTVIERKENEYWKIEVSHFKMAMMGLFKFVGEWTTRKIDEDKSEVIYTYTLHGRYWILYPLQWLFTKIYWRLYMRHALECVRKLAYEKAPYLHE